MKSQTQLIAEAEDMEQRIRDHDAETSSTGAPSEPQAQSACCSVAVGSASVGIGQRTAAQVWNAFKAEELRYVDILEMCAVLMCNVADKSQSTDHEIAHMTRQMMHDMRRRSSSPNDKLTP